MASRHSDEVRHRLVAGGSIQQVHEPVLMEVVFDFFAKLAELPIYRHGWLLFSILLIVPAIVSGNLVQHEVSRLLARKCTFQECRKSLLLNSLVLVLCTGIAFYGFFLR